MSDNVISVVQKTIRYFRKRVTRTTIADYLLSHPHYPALKSVCDGFKKWGIEHYPIRLKIPEIMALQGSFIAHLNDGGGQLAFVYHVSENEVVYSTGQGKQLHEACQTFTARLSGAVIIVKPNNKAGESDFRIKRNNEWLDMMFLPITIFTILSFGLYPILTGNIPIADKYWPLAGTIISGILVSLVLVLNEFKIHHAVLQSLCRFGKKADCHSVIDSKASHVFGWMGWSDIGFLYFTGLLLYMLTIQLQDSMHLMAFVSALALPYPVYSVYYQAIKLKKWCLLCLLVQCIIVMEFILLLPYLKPVNLVFTDFLSLAISFLVPGTLYYGLKLNWVKRNSQRKDHNALLTLRGDPEVFRLMLMKSEPINIPVKENSLVFGNPAAENTLTVFMSFHCKHCSALFAKISVIMTSLQKVKVVLVFWADDDLLSRKLINQIYRLYKQQSNLEVLAFIDNWFNNTENALKEMHSSDAMHACSDCFERIFWENRLLFEQCEINGTPQTFLDGYKYPSVFELEQLEFLSDEILSTIREHKRQEAHALEQPASCRHTPLTRKEVM